MAPRNVLIADPDPAAVNALAPALRRRGYHVHTAHDGSRALELAILRSPDLVLLDEEAPLVDARSFVRILRTNPRTARVPVLLAGAKDDPGRARLGEYVRKPYDVEDVVARVERVLRRADAARAVSGGAGLQGDLAEIPAFDLLQMLAMNRKTGRLAVERRGARGEIALVEGRIVDAVAGGVRGEKAVHRLAVARDGRFAFAPGAPEGPARIDRPVEELVMEAARQADELAALQPGAPDGGDVVALAVAPAAVPEGLHPVTAEVVALLAAPRTVQDLLDRAVASDVDVLRALGVLLERGYVRRGARAAPAPAAAGPALGDAEARALRRRAGAAAPSAVAKLLVAGGGPLARRAALARLATWTGFAAEAAGAPVEFGTLARLAVADGLLVDLVALPSDPALAPLRTPLAAGAVGALVLPPADALVERLDGLARALRFPVGACGGDAPVGWVALDADPAEALRQLLAAAARAGS